MLWAAHCGRSFMASVARPLVACVGRVHRSTVPLSRSLGAFAHPVGRACLGSTIPLIAHSPQALTPLGGLLPSGDHSLQSLAAMDVGSWGCGLLRPLAAEAARRPGRWLAGWLLVVAGLAPSLVLLRHRTHSAAGLGGRRGQRVARARRLQGLVGRQGRMVATAVWLLLAWSAGCRGGWVKSASSDRRRHRRPFFPPRAATRPHQQDLSHR